MRNEKLEIRYQRSEITDQREREREPIDGKTMI
jgi:hypothetical protein